MIRIEQLKLPYTHTEELLSQAIQKTLRVKEPDVIKWQIVKKSLDARKKPQIFAIYTIDVSLREESQFLKRNRQKNIGIAPKHSYQFPKYGTKVPEHRPVIIGSGPSGLFCAYMLALHGYRPILMERGAAIEERQEMVNHFWATGELNPNTNVQFGEGGAGTFSDGKLNTMVKDKEGRGRKILEIFVNHGAPEEILYLNKPHIGTDILAEVVKNMRNAIIAHGGEVRFHQKLVDVFMEEGQVSGILIEDTISGEIKKSPASIVVLAIGHSARDTFEMLHERQIPMQSKSFAVGVRVEHPQNMIDEAQYGILENGAYPAAEYKLAAQLPSGRGVYSFCMCPGGYVVNASSEEGGLCVNGMSYHDRDGENANSAIIVTVSNEDFGSAHPLAGIWFQRKLEGLAYHAGAGKIPVQKFEDFCQGRETTSIGNTHPNHKGAWQTSNVRSLLPADIGDAIEEGITIFGKKIKGFDHKDTLLSGIESRTSSPIRITRNDKMESIVQGIFPCGEGAGYAGGITSAAMDGMKVAEIVAETYASFDGIRRPS